MKKYILIIAALLAVWSAGAQTDATLDKVSETFTLNEDGSIEQNYQKVMRFHTHYSFFSLFGETFVVYNPEYQDLKINHCYTIQKDGTRVDAPANAFNKVLPRDAANAPAYNHLIEMVITHTGLELGATVYLDYTITTKPEMQSTLDIDRTFSQQGANIKEYTVKVNLPEGKKLTWKMADSNVKPVVKGNSYTWTLRNLPAGAGEQLATKNGEGLPRLTATTAESLAESLAPMTIESRELCRVDQALLAEAKCDGCKAKAIQNYIVNGLGSSNVKPEAVGYRLRQCGDVMQSAYGTMAEKARAMAKLMRAEGLDAEMVVVMPKNVTPNAKSITNYLVRWDGEFYGVAQMGTVDVALRADRDDIYTLAGEKIAVEPKTLAVENSLENHYSAKCIDDDELTICTLNPTENGVDAWHLPALNSSRKEKCELPSAIDENDTYVIALDGKKSLTADKNIAIANKAGKVAISIKNEADKVVVSRSISLPKSTYTAKEYADLRKLIQAWQSKAGREVVITK